MINPLLYLIIFMISLIGYGMFICKVFNINENSFVLPQDGEPRSLIKKYSDSNVVPMVGQENLPKQSHNLNKELAGGEIVIEFSPDTFETPASNQELNPNQDFSISKSKPNGEGL